MQLFLDPSSLTDHIDVLQESTSESELDLVDLEQVEWILLPLRLLLGHITILGLTRIGAPGLEETSSLELL